MSEDWVHIIMCVLMTAGGAVVSLIAWLLRSTVAKIDRVEGRGSKHEERIAVLENASVSATVQDHEGRLRALETGISAIRADMAVLIAEIKNVRGLVEGLGKRRGS